MMCMVFKQCLVPVIVGFILISLQPRTDQAAEDIKPIEKQTFDRLAES